MQEGDLYVADKDTEHDDTIKDVVDINVLSACLFMVVASVFLLVVYYVMSEWFLILLVILFCIGGFEVLYLILYIAHLFLLLLMLSYIL